MDARPPPGTPGEPSPWGPLRWPGLASLGVLAYGTTGYMLMERWSFVDSLYMTILTMTTVGFREVHPLDDTGKWFTISLIVLGVGLLLVTITILAGIVQEGRIAERWRRRRMQKRVDLLTGHHIVCGFGRVGRTVAESLAGERVPFVVVDKSEERESDLLASGFHYVFGDATHEHDLMRAGATRARSLISAVDDDAQNIYITIAARAFNPSLWIVARASDEESENLLLRANADRVFSPFVTGGREMANAAVRPDVVDYIDLESERAPTLRVEELCVADDLAGRRLADVTGPRTALAVRRSSGELVTPPDGSMTLQAGDVLLVLGERAPEGPRP